MLNMNQSSEVKYVKDEVVKVIGQVNLGLVCQLVVIFGCIANIINMVIFVRIGFKETINISLLSLAVSDFGSCFVCIWLNITVLPWFQHLDLPFDPTQIQMLISVRPHLMLTQITALVTSYMMAERCVCITKPLKVKTLFTRRRVTSFILFTWVLIIALSVPYYYVTRYGWKFYAAYNRTLYGVVHMPGRGVVVGVTAYVSNALFMLLPFVAICVCTAFMVVSLKRKMQWRKTATTGLVTAGSGETSRKDARVAKMVVFICILFVICHLPKVAINLAHSLSANFALMGKYKVYTLLATGIATTMSCVNASLNIFMYHRYSSNYRMMFRKTFRIKKKQTRAK